MKGRKSIVALLVSTLLVGIAPRNAHALPGSIIDLGCWSGPPRGVVVSPNPTIGCTLLWGPGGQAQFVDWTVLFACITTGCGVVNNPPPLFRNIIIPPSGTLHSQIAGNCFGSTVQGIVDSFAVSLKLNINGGDIRVQDEESASGGPVAPYCPGGTGSSMVVQ